MKNNNNKDLYLTDYNTNDKPWDTHKGESDDVSGIYATSVEFERYARRIHECSGCLHFGWSNNKETGETKLRLRRASFCRVRNCPICQWRRSLMWQARFYQSLHKIVEINSTARWVFLTLTVRNCAIEDLSTTLTKMNLAFQRLKDRKEFKPVFGWIRTTEVTLGKDGSAHPHFHTLMMVPPSWFTRDYVKQERWVAIWCDCLRVNYEPNVDIRTVKARIEGQSLSEVLQDAVSETLKYSVKPSDMIEDPNWFLELTRQTFKRRFVATGGFLKNVFRVDEESNQDLVLADGEEDSDDDGTGLAFDWKAKERRYKRAPQYDKVTKSDN